MAKRREAAEAALAARSAQREELSRRAYAARSAAERIGYRAESARAAAASVEARVARYQELLATLQDEAAADQDDPEAAGRIAGLEESLAALNRDREAELARQLAELQDQLAEAGRRVAEQTEAVAVAAAERTAAEAAAEQVRGELREAERAVEAGRREAARVGSELAAANQFLRHHAGAPHGAAALADELDVDSGYELAVAAALDGRLRAAVVDDRPAAASLLDRAGADGGRTLVVGDTGDTGDTGGTAAPGAADGAAPAPGAARLIDHVRAQGRALAVARALLSDTWLVEDLEHVAADFRGVAVTRSGRVWSARTRELRQAPAVGEDRVLAERNRRDQLVSESERAAQAELDARAGVERATAAMSEADSARDRLTNAHRAAVRTLDELREEQRRIGALIERRRAAPDDGPEAGRRSQLAAELAAERRMLERAERERAERARRTERVRTGLARDRELVPAVAKVIAALEEVSGAIAQRLAGFDEALAADREAGEHVAVELRTCAQQEAELHAAHQRRERGAHPGRGPPPARP